MVRLFVLISFKNNQIGWFGWRAIAASLLFRRRDNNNKIQPTHTAGHKLDETRLLGWFLLSNSTIDT
jgi:hypothetical protein